MRGRWGLRLTLALHPIALFAVAIRALALHPVTLVVTIECDVLEDDTLRCRGAPLARTLDAHRDRCRQRWPNGRANLSFSIPLSVPLQFPSSFKLSLSLPVSLFALAAVSVHLHIVVEN